MSSAVDIANNALTRLGADRIISFADETTEARTMSTIYEQTKAALLRSYPWNCAVKRAKLAQLADAPVNEYPFQYAVPEGCLRILDVWSGDYKTTRQGDGQRAWVLEGKTILSHDENIIVKYVDNISESEMDIHVEEVLIAKLAMEASYTLQASVGNQTTMTSLYQMKLEEARTVDNLETSHTTFDISTLRAVRR
mgnify:CR=1 FL=1